jgi:hypothetical protein
MASRVVPLLPAERGVTQMADSGEGPYTKFTALGTAVLVLLTYMLLADSLRWWPFAAAEVQRADTESVTACTFIPATILTCTSRDPRIKVDFTNFSDTTGCTFSSTLQWGDGSETSGVPVTGGPTGPTFLASHFYTSPGTYNIQVTGVVTAGQCSLIPNSYTFRLLGT